MINKSKNELPLKIERGKYRILINSENYNEEIISFSVSDDTKISDLGEMNKLKLDVSVHINYYWKVSQ